MKEYQELIHHVLENGTHENNRTKESTIACFGYDYKIDVGEGYPLLTTKKMDTFRWDSMLHETEWYLSGKHHIRQLTEKTGIWDAWSDKDNNLPSAYGRFWRRYPVPDEEGQLPGEAWMSEDSQWTQTETTLDVEFAFGTNVENPVSEAVNRLEKTGEQLNSGNVYFDSPTVENTDDYQKVTIPVTVGHSGDVSADELQTKIENRVNPFEVYNAGSTLTFDQLQFVVDALRGENPHRGPESRRLVVQAWHPSNAQKSSLPPCHFTYVFNVQDGKLNLHLTQRSADTALGVPFNIAAYSLLLKLVASQTEFDVGEFSHTLVDAHVYCGRGERSEWYENNLGEFQEKMSSVEKNEDYLDIKEWILENAPEDDDSEPSVDNYGYDHTPGLLEQLSREPLGRSELKISDDATINNVTYEDFELVDYESDEGLRFSVAE